MQISKKGVIWGVIIAILIVLNIATLTTMWVWEARIPYSMPQRTMINKPDGRKIFEKELNFNQQQMDSVDKFRKEHFDIVQKYMDESKKYKEELIEQMKNPDNVKVQNLISKIADNEKNIETETFNHFMKIRNLCDDKQKEKFSEIFKIIITNRHRGRENRIPRMQPDGERRGMMPSGSIDMFLPLEPLFL